MGSLTLKVKWKDFVINKFQFKCDYCDCTAYQLRKDIKKHLQIKSDRYKILECTDCHLISVSPLPTPEENLQIYKDYNTKKGRIAVETTRRKEIYPQKTKELKKYSRGRRLLDIGAGLGTFVHMAKESGFEATGIEMSREQVLKAKELYGLDLINIDVFENYDKLGKFDVIHMYHVMEHLKSPAMMFSILKELLNDDGILLIEVPFQLKKIQAPLYRLMRKEKPGIWNNDHLYFFSPNTLKNYINKNDFHIIKFNQNRIEQFCERRTNACKYFIRYYFDKLTASFYIPSGGFLEFYCRNIKK